MHEAINTAVPVDMESRHIIEALRSGIPSRSWEGAFPMRVLKYLRNFRAILRMSASGRNLPG